MRKPGKPKAAKNTDVRILPAVIGVAAILFTLKAGGLVFSAHAADAETAPPASAAEAAKEPEAAPAAQPAAPAAMPFAPAAAQPAAIKPPKAAPTTPVQVSPAPAGTTPDPLASINAALPNPPGKPTLQQGQNPPPAPDGLPTEIAGVSSAEMDVLTSLADRRDVLEERQRELDTKANVLAAAEKRVDDKIVQLKALQTKIEQLMGQRDAKETEQLDGLVKIYTAMKPKDAARIFESLNDEVRIGVAGRMKSDAMAGIFAALPAEVAQKLSVQLAGRYKMPGDAAAAAASPTAAPAAPPAAAPAAATAPKPGG